MYSLRIVCTILITLNLIESGWTQSNYCEASLCRHGRLHIGCNNEGGYGRGCSRKAFTIAILPNLRRYIVRTHNALRNRTAAGNVNGYQPAIRMASMTWNEELATLAKLHVKRCQLRRDRCRNTEMFRFSGQNSGRTKWRNINPTTETVAKGLINAWFKENEKCNMRQISNLTTAIVGRCGHFTSMIQEKNNAVGCAILSEIHNGRNMQFMTCNYAYNNIKNAAVYRAGAVASKCTTGVNPQFASLCSIREAYRLKSIRD